MEGPFAVEGKFIDQFNSITVEIVRKEYRYIGTRISNGSVPEHFESIVEYRQPNAEDDSHEDDDQ